MTRARGVARELQLGLFAAVELAWLFAWSVALGTWLDPAGPGALIGLAGLLALLVAAVLLTRLALSTPPRAQRARVALPAFGVFAAALVGGGVLWTFHGADTWAETAVSFASGAFGFRLVGAMLLALAMWWRGIAAGRSRLTPDAVESGMRGATLAMAGLFALDALTPTAAQAPVGSLLGAATVLIFAGLVGLPLARILDVSTHARRQGEPVLAVNRQWLALLLGTVGGMLALTVILALVLTFDRLDRLLHPVGVVLDAILTVLVYVIGVPLGLLIQLLVYLIQSLMHPTQPPQRPQVADLGQLRRLQDQAQGGLILSPLLLLVLKVLIVAAIVLGVAWLLARAVFRRSEWHSEDGVEEARDFVWSWAELKRAVLAWLRSFLRRSVERLAAARRPGPAPAAKPVRALDPRGIYRELLQLGAQLGRRRQPSETPREYAGALVKVSALADGPAEVATVTAAYSQDRYAAAPPDPSAVAAARAALDRLHALANAEPDRIH